MYIEEAAQKTNCEKELLESGLFLFMVVGQ